MKSEKTRNIIIISIVIIIIGFLVVMRINTAKKIYEGDGMIITIIGNKKVTVTNEYGVLAENAKLENIPTPEETENPENFSRFVKVNIQGGDVIAGFLKDGKTIEVSGIKYQLVEK